MAASSENAHSMPYHIKLVINIYQFKNQEVYSYFIENLFKETMLSKTHRI